MILTTGDCPIATRKRSQAVAEANFDDKVSFSTQGRDASGYPGRDKAA